jgi:hypothetical protein
VSKNFRVNGDDQGFYCPVAIDWIEFHARSKEATRQMEIVYKEVCALKEPLTEISQTLKDMKENLVGPATGRKQVQLSVFMMVVGFLCIVLVLQAIGSTKKNIEFGPIKIQSGETP